MNRHLQGFIDVAMSEAEALLRAEAAARAPVQSPPPAPPAEKPKNIWRVRDLLAADLPEPAWLVPDLLPTGLTLLAGRPKLGKSWLALQLGVAVGGGGTEGVGRFLDRQVPPGKAVYIALEDSMRRMQVRLRRLGAPSDCLLFVIPEWPPLNGRGLGDMRGLIEQSTVRLVVIDTLTRAFTGRVDWDSVGQATEALAHLQSLAMDHDRAILLVDHHRKGNGASSDVVDDLMGSTGKSAVADVLWGLYRKRGTRGATLRVTGRDLEDQELSLAFDPTTCAWQVSDVAQGVASGSVQEVILEGLEALDGEATVSQLAEHLEKDRGQISREMAELEHKGAVRRKGKSRTAPYVLVRAP
ncbi:MAG: AAA family ATPase [Chloroflexi bacterium]|nr:AAA family ATPase [Chloroflexota bacterium]